MYSRSCGRQLGGRSSANNIIIAFCGCKCKHTHTISSTSHTTRHDTTRHAACSGLILSIVYFSYPIVHASCSRIKEKRTRDTRSVRRRRCCVCLPDTKNGVPAVATALIITIFCRNAAATLDRYVSIARRRYTSRLATAFGME